MTDPQGLTAVLQENEYLKTQLAAQQRAIASLEEDLRAANEEDLDPDLRYLEYGQRARVQALRVSRSLLVNRGPLSAALPSEHSVDQMITLADYVIGDFSEVLEGEVEEVTEDHYHTGGCDPAGACGDGSEDLEDPDLD